MVKRKRIPLQLKGTDEQYFRTKEITGQPDDVEKGREPVAEQPVETVQPVAPEPAIKAPTVKRSSPAKASKKSRASKLKRMRKPRKGALSAASSISGHR